MPPRALADEEPLRLRRELEQLILDERVVEDQIRFAQPFERAQREQLGITGPCTDQ